MGLVGSWEPEALRGGGGRGASAGAKPSPSELLRPKATQDLS